MSNVFQKRLKILCRMMTWNMEVHSKKNKSDNCSNNSCITGMSSPERFIRWVDVYYKQRCHNCFCMKSNYHTTSHHQPKNIILLAHMREMLLLSGTFHVLCDLLKLQISAFTQKYIWNLNKSVLYYANYFQP